MGWNVRIIVIISSIILLVSSAYSIKDNELSAYSKQWYEYELITPITHKISVEDEAQIFDLTDMVLHVKVLDPIQDRESVVKYNEDNIMDGVEYAYTNTEVEIIDIWHDPLNTKMEIGDQITFREFYAIMETDREFLYIHDDYTPLLDNSEYVLYVGVDDYEEELIYYNTAHNLSTFNIDSTDPFDFLHHNEGDFRLSSSNVLKPQELNEAYLELSLNSISDNPVENLSRVSEKKFEIFEQVLERFNIAPEDL
ncbi:hypothetical protein ACE1TF_07935 [Geomicrobium sp. JSM 1781026]|uniref:hypothetical protein n=1 Tax=Geomicrobium sp. JSM 1781026 TaxID=3344580 RepID=UPI0035C0C803